MFRPLAGMRIRTRILFSSTFTLVLIALFVFAYYPGQQRLQIYRAVQLKDHSMADLVALGVGVGMASGDFAAAMDALDVVKRDTDIVYCLMLDENNEFIAAYNPANLHLDLPLLLDKTDINVVDGRSLHMVKTPVLYNQVNYGTLFLASSLTAANQSIADNMITTFKVSIGLILFGVAVSFFFSHLITRRLIQLRNAAEMIAGGQYDCDLMVTDGPSDEIGDLSNAFNDMAKNVQKALDSLRESEEQLRQSQKMEAIGRLAGGVAHDFNNLLAIITGNNELLQLRLEDNDPRQKNVEEINQAAERAAGLTGQLLAFSRKQFLAPRVLDLNAIVGDMEKMLRRLIGENIELSSNLESTLGAVKADPGQVEQVIMNLVVNARDAMPRGGKLTIGTSNIELDEDFVREYPEATPGPYVLLAVGDTGTGMDEHTLSHLFEPFFTTKGYEKGTGLGLATVYGIIKQSGGHIVVYSVPELGTSFNVFLPRVEEQVDHQASRTVQPTAYHGTETILLAEDEKGVRELVSTTLRTQGYTVLAAPDGAAALAIAGDRTEPIDLLLTDVIMPKIGGFDLAEQLARVHPETKLILMSGYTDETVTRHGKLDSTTVFLQKPFNLGDLARTVRDVLDKPLPVSGQSSTSRAG